MVLREITMTYKSLFLITYIFQSFFSIVAQPSDTSFLKIIFAGDIMGHDAQISGAYVDSLKQYNYEPTFRYVKPYVESADIAIGNLEVTLGGPPYMGYPQFSSPDNLAIEAKKAGFDVLIMANNHALDRGSKGFNRTLQVLDSFNIIHTGTFKDERSFYRNNPLIVEKNNIRLAILNYTYGTNGLKIKPPAIINRIDTLQIRQDLTKADQANPDFIFVTIHWGVEYELDENKTQRSLTDFLIKNGADAIIGSHPHVVQPIKTYFKDKSDSLNYNIVVYSLGNFVSNQRERYKNGGIIFEISLMKTSLATKIQSYNYLPVWVYRKDNESKSTFYILPVKLYYENEDYFNFLDHDKYKISMFYKDTKEHLKDTKENDYYVNFKLTTPD